MDPHSRGVRVQVFIGETDQAGRVPRYQAMLEYLRREGAAGATVVRGVAGFGANSRIHTAAILRLSLDLPMVLTWIDAPGRVERLLPGLRELAGSGIITVEEVGIAGYGGRRLEQLRFDLQVRDVMIAPVLSISREAPVAEAVERLLGSGRRAAPVVDADGRVVGVLSSGDLVARAGLGARLELLAAMSPEARRGYMERLEPRRVGDVMTPDPTTIRGTDTVAAATHLMAERRIKRLPVVDAGGRLAGILARSDILRAVGETFPRDVLAAAEHPGAQTVRDLMRTEVPTVPADADLAALLDAVVSTRLNRAVIVDEAGRPIGIASDAEILEHVDPSATGGVVGALMRTAARRPGGDLRASDVASRAPLAAGPATSIAEAAQLMTEHSRKLLCVVDDDRRLLGIVDRADLLRAAGDALRELAAAGTGTEENDD